MRPVEYPREKMAHQLLRDPSCLSGGEDVCKGSVQHTDSLAPRQHHCCVIRQSPGRHSVPPGNRIGEGALDVVPETEDHVEGPTPTRQGQCDCRQEIQNNEGQIGLDVEPSDLQLNSICPNISNLHPGCQHNYKSSTAGGQILWHWQQMPSCRIGRT